MSHTNLYELKQYLSEGQILICFNGALSQTIIEDMGEAIRRYITVIDPDKRGQLKDIFSVFVEQTQNIRHYADEVAESDDDRRRFNAAVIAISCNGDSYTVSAGNPMRRRDVDPLAEHIQMLNGLDKNALKQRYKEVLRSPRGDGPTGGAGLGLIDMARRARQPMEWESVAIDADHAFFSLRVTV